MHYWTAIASVTPRRTRCSPLHAVDTAAVFSVNIFLTSRSSLNALSTAAAEIVYYTSWSLGLRNVRTMRKWKIIIFCLFCDNFNCASYLWLGIFHGGVKSMEMTCCSRKSYVSHQYSVIGEIFNRNNFTYIVGVLNCRRHLRCSELSPAGTAVFYKLVNASIFWSNAVGINRLLSARSIQYSWSVPSLCP